MKPWINHDIHRFGRVVTSPEITKVRLLTPYPTMQRLHELFYLRDGKLEWIRSVRTKGSQGWINPKDGKRYLRVDDKQCQVERLIRIYMGEE